MVTVDKLRSIFNDKLNTSNSMDAAFGKAVWISYLEGLLEGTYKNDNAYPKIKEDLKQGYKGVFKMGFSLETFFNDTTAIFESKMTDAEKLVMLSDYFKSQKQYAIDCHQL